MCTGFVSLSEGPCWGRKGQRLGGAHDLWVGFYEVQENGLP